VKSTMETRWLMQVMGCEDIGGALECSKLSGHAIYI
jgi:hypothetical protein